MNFNIEDELPLKIGLSQNNRNTQYVVSLLNKFGVCKT